MLIVGGNQSAGGYEVANSLRFDDGSSDYLNRTPASAGNRKTFTISVWIKRSVLTSQDHIASASGTEIRFTSTDNTAMRDGGTNYGLSDAVFRDVSAWYHIVYAIDTTQATESNRIKLYVNGTQFTVTTFPTLNFDFGWNNNTEHQIGASSGTEFFGGYMAEFVNIDGQQLDATSFGEFDGDTGIWKPIDVSGLTFGTNGFYLPFENSAALGQDDSGNGNNFTVNNLTSIDQTTDTPTNNYATFNPLTIPSSSGLTLSDGNLSLSGSSTDAGAKATLGVSSGKWYWEVKANVASSGSDRHLVATDIVRQITSATDPNSQGIWGIQSRSGSGATLNSYTNGTFSNVNTGSTGYDDNTIISVALDMDNGKLYFAKNGTWTDLAGNVGDPVAGTNPTFTGLPTDGTIILPYVENRQAGTPSSEINFGNPPFSISTGNADDNGYGNFEYDVPDGYYALNTKNLAEYG